MATNLKETGELLKSITDTIVQTIEVASDNKFDISEIVKYLDEAVGWEAAVRGLVEGFPNEARIATVTEIETLFDEQFNKLANAGLNPMLVGAIISGLKGAYYAYAIIAQSGKSALILKRN